MCDPNKLICLNLQLFFLHKPSFFTSHHPQFESTFDKYIRVTRGHSVLIPPQDPMNGDRAVFCVFLHVSR